MKREPNFEVMRTIAMFFIVVYHCLTHGVGDVYGFSVCNPTTLSNLVFSDFLLVFSSIAVNLYVMVSGYFLVDLNFKMSRMLRTWTYACFYSIAIALLFMSLQIEPFSIVALGKSFFPISTDAYWFVTQYIGLLILSPFLSLLVKQLSYKQYFLLLIGGAFICLALIPDFPLAKRFHVAHGNSVWSFAYLFLVAGFIKHYLKRIPMAWLMTAALFVTLLAMGCEIFFGYQNDSIHLFWFNYNGLPFVLSVIVFIIIRQMQMAESGIWKILVKFAPYTFGVYLIHDHLMMRGWLWDTVSLTSVCDHWTYPFIVVGLCCLIFFVAAFIESIRKKLFAVLRIDNLISKVDRWSFYS
jgi:surface polysaccharide O-acyltransferase-like enzyme